MTLPSNVRVNTNLPFPALVKGSGPITVSKNNGIWLIGFNALAAPTSVPTDFVNSYLLVYNSVSNTYSRVSLATLISQIGASVNAGVRSQRAVSATPIAILSTDQIINCNIGTAAACTLPSAVSRVGAPLTFKDLGQATANHITLTAAAGDTIDGQPTYTLRANYQGVTLVPLADAVHQGWSIQ